MQNYEHQQGSHLADDFSAVGRDEACLNVAEEVVATENAAVGLRPGDNFKEHTRDPLRNALDCKRKEPILTPRIES